MTRWIVLTMLSVTGLIAGTAVAQTNEPVRPAHGSLEPGTRTDDLGITMGIPVEHPGRRYPATREFPTGPEVGERLPTFSLPNQHGQMIDYHADRGDAKSIVVFYRSAVW